MEMNRREQRRLSRANWWYCQMREVVDKAIDCQPHSTQQEPQGEVLTPEPLPNHPNNTTTANDEI